MLQGRSNLKRIGFGVACLIVALVGMRSYMAFGKPEVLEFDQVSLFKMEVDPTTHVPVSIAGLCGRSAYSVYSINTQNEHGALIVRVNIHLARSGESGRFFYKLQIPTDVNELLFGDDKHLLWKRG
jgi:hypothetical protein